MPVTAEIDGVVVGHKEVLDLPAAVERAGAFLFELASQQHIALPAGTYVSTGAITGVHDAVCGSRSTLDFGQWGLLSLKLVSEVPFA